MDDRWVLIDEQTGLHVGWYFWLRLLDEVNRSARYGAPFGLLLLDAEECDASKRALIEAAGCVPTAIRATDLGGILGPGRVGVILVEQDVASAEVARDRVMERMTGSLPKDVRFEAQLLCYPRDAVAISALLTAGWPHTERRQEQAQRSA